MAETATIPQLPKQPKNAWRRGHWRRLPELAGDEKRRADAAREAVMAEIRQQRQERQ